MRRRQFVDKMTQWMVTGLLIGAGACVNSSTYGTVDLGGSQLYVSKSSVVADGNDSATVALVLQTGANVPVSGVAVTFSATGCNIVQPAAVSDANGLVTASIASTQVGARTVYATVSRGDLSTRLGQTGQLTFTSAAIADGSLPGTAFDFIFVALNAARVPDSGYTGTVHFSSTDPLAVLPADYTVAAAQHGQVVFTGGVKLYTAGIQVVRAADVKTGIVVAEQSYVVRPGPATSLVVRGPPATINMGVATSVQAFLYDSWHNMASLYDGTLVLQTSDANALLAASHTFTPADQGNYTFAPIVMNTPGIQTLHLADPAAAALMWTDSSLTVLGAAPQQIALGVANPAQAGVAGDLGLSVLDQHGNPGANFTGTIAIAVTDPNATAPSEVVFVDGMAQQTASATRVTWQTVGQQSISATVVSGPHLLGVQQAVTVSPGPLSRFSMTGPSTVVAGQYANLVVSALDGFGNVDSGYTGTARFVSTSAQGVAPTAHNFTAGDAGSYAFAIVLETAGMQVFSVYDETQSGLAGNITIVVQPAAVSNIRVLGTATSITAGGNINLQITPVDRFGNTETQFTGLVNLAASDANASAPAGWTFNSNDAGSHVFSQVVLRTAGNQNFTATVDSNPNIVGQSNNIQVQAGSPTALAFIQAAGVSQAACAGIGSVAVAAVDVYGNAAIAADEVILSLKGGTPGALLGGTSVAAYGVGQVATFNNLAVNLAGSGYQLVAANSDANHPLASTTSAAFAVAASPVSLAFGTPSGTGGCIGIPYTLTSACPADLDFQLDANNSGQLLPMRMAGSPNTAQGVEHVMAANGMFLWDSTADLPRGSYAQARVQTAATAGGQSANATLALSVDNSFAMSAVAVAPSGASLCVGVADMNLDGAPDVVACTGEGITVALNSAPAGTLGSGNAYALSTPPAVLAIADINRDGQPDVVVADTAGDGYVLFGTGGGNLSAPAAMIVPAGMVNLVLADIDQDGVLDQVGTSDTNTLSVQNGLRSGGFAAPQTVSLPEQPTSLAVADVNQDGRLDAVVGTVAGTYTALGSSAGLQSPVSLPGDAATTGLAVADVNHDGSPDIVASFTGADGAVWLGSAGAFGMATTLAGAGSLSALHVKDLDLDGKLDFLALGTGGASWFLGDGNGGFAAGTGVAVAGAPDALALLDVDLDGHTDAVAVLGTFGTMLLRNTMPHACSWGFGTATAASVPMTVNDADRADFNEDGKPDLFVVGRAARLAMLLTNDGSGTFTAAGGWFCGAAPGAPALADYNGDGHVDVALANAQDGTLLLLAGDGNGNLSSTTLTAGMPQNPVAVVHGTFFGDGKQSLAVAGGNDQGIQILHNRGDAVFLPGSFLSQGAPVTNLVTADINGDGAGDLAVFFSGSVQIYTGTGTGTFQAAAITATCTPVGNPIIRDFDRDLLPDLAMLCSDNSLRMWTGDGSGNFAASIQSYPPYVSGLAAADLNGDGYVDFATGGDTRFNISYLQPDHTFATAAYATLEAADGVLAMDVNADGFPDVVTLHPSLTANSFNDGNGSFTSPSTNTACGAQAKPFTLADINADGWVDLLNAGCGDFMNINLGAAGGNFQTMQALATGRYPQQVAIHDINHDGRPDAVVSATSDYNDLAPATTIFDNTGDANLFSVAGTLNVNQESGVSPVSFADLNQDGNIDLLLGSEVDRCQYTCLGDGMSGFHGCQQVGCSLGFGVSGAFAADVNADGNTDVISIAPATPGTLFVFLGNGAGGAINNGATFYPSYNSSGTYALADFNHDGSLDIASPPSTCQVGSCGFMAFAIGDAHGNFVTGTGIAIDLQPSDVAAADVNHDGNVDLIAMYGTSTAIGVYLGDGRGHFAAARYFPSEGVAGYLDAHDLNFDGKIDIVTQPQGGGIVVRLGR